jgi:hypothetical protein
LKQNKREEKAASSSSIKNVQAASKELSKESISSESQQRSGEEVAD